MLLVMQIRSVQLIQKHREWMEEVNEIAKQVEVEPTLPRMCKRQTLRSNPSVTDTESYYRISVTIPFLHHVSQEFDARYKI